MATDNTSKIHPIVAVKLAQIDADDSFNVRKTYDEDAIKGMKESVFNNSMLNTLLVMPHTDPVKVNAGVIYKLIGGFTRFKALSEYEAETGKTAFVQAKIIEFEDRPDNPADLQAKLLNICENIDRAPLLPYEIAQRCYELKQENPNLTTKALVSRIGYSRGYINNLLRMIEDLAEPIKVAWQENHPLAQPALLLRLATKPQEEQMKIWEKKVFNWLVRMNKDHDSSVQAENDTDVSVDDQNDDTEKTELDASSEPVRARPKPSTLIKLREAFVRDRKLPAPARKMGIAIMNFVLGFAESVPDVYDPKEAQKTASKGAEKRKSKQKTDKPARNGKASTKPARNGKAASKAASSKGRNSGKSAARKAARSPGQDALTVEA